MSVINAESWKAEGIIQQSLACIKGRDYDRAAALLTEAIKVAPSLVEAWTLRGNILLAQERFFDALLHYDRVISMRPSAFDAWNNRGQCLGNMGRWDEAEEAFKRSAEIQPAYEPHMGLASMYCTLLRLDEAAEQYRKAAEIDGDPDAAFNLGTTLMGMGRWKEGFPFYDLRWKTRQFMPQPRLQYPQWKGEKDGTVVLYTEQGYGDEIMASRWVNALPINQVVLEVRPPFTRLAKTLGVHVVQRGNALPYDVKYSCAALDMPGILGLNWSQIPRKPYLTNPFPGRFADRMATLPRGLNVGLCWFSGSHLDTLRAARMMKSIPVGDLRGLAMRGVNLISLQKPAEKSPPEMGLIDWTDELHDLADTAALIDELDLVITVDTAVAHLAGAMGKPVWNFVRYSGYWPWLAPDVASSPSHSIWYESMTLYRQLRLNDWSDPIESAISDLRNLLQAKAVA